MAEFIKQTQYDYQIIFEDDIEFRQKIKIQELIYSLGGGFDCFLFAHNAAVVIEKVGDKFSRVIGAHTASAYIVTRKFAPVLLSKFAGSVNNLSKFRSSPKEVVNSFFAIDILWKELQITHKFLTTVPSMAFQYPSYSDILQRDVDYGV